MKENGKPGNQCFWYSGSIPLSKTLPKLLKPRRIPHFSLTDFVMGIHQCVKVQNADEIL